MAENFFGNFLKEQKLLFEKLEEIDIVQREKGEYYCRYISKSFADRKAFYQITGETPKMYILNWVAGESPYPDWGESIKLYKKNVKEMIDGRDYFSDMIKLRKKANA